MTGIYQSRIKQFTDESDRIRKRTTLYAFLRLLFFVAAILLFILFFQENLILSISLSLLSFASLLLFVSMTQKLSGRKILLEQLVAINQNEIQCLNGNIESFDGGGIYQDDDHNYTSDLDIFGKNSLYQFLNRTGLYKGGEKLAAWLIHGIPPDKIPAWQEAIAELAERVHWRQVFQAHGRLARDNSEEIRSMEKWILETPGILNNTVIRIMLWGLPALTLTSMILAFFIIPYNIPIFFVLLQLGIVALNLRRTNAVHNQVTRKFNLLTKYSVLLESIESESFHSDPLNSLKSKLSEGNLTASRAVRELARLVERIDWRINMVAGALLNALLMWDLQCVLRMEKWKHRYKKKLPLWFDVMADYDALSSLANFKYNRPSSVYPRVNEEGPLLQGRGMYHPLIPDGENVSNDIEMEDFGEFILITGSNMAGKSTFLRTLGVNMALAFAGSVVCADSLTIRPLSMVTSMRITDSLSSRESTFYAELKRLRKILEMHRKGDKVFILLDEILKGTNSRDKHYGSEMLIRQLIDLGGAGLIATHDLELSKLEEEFPGRLRNYCFEVQIENQEFHFDYKLRKGVCRTMNATELMKKMGIEI